MKISSKMNSVTLDVFQWLSTAYLGINDPSEKRVRYLNNHARKIINSNDTEAEKINQFTKIVKKAVEHEVNPCDTLNPIENILLDDACKLIDFEAIAAQYLDDVKNATEK